MNFEHLDITDPDGNYHVPDPVICRTAEKLYALWPVIAGIYLQRAPRPRKKDMLEFYRAAKECLRREVSPEAYMHSILEGMARVGQYWPNLVSSSRVYDLGCETDSDSRTRWLAHYQSQVQLFEARAPIFGVVPLLSDESVGFTPLFRCVMAWVSGAHDLARKYRDSARLELAAVPIAREVFAEQLPEFLT